MENQKIISENSFKKCTVEKLHKYDHILEIDYYHIWEGLSFKQYSELKQKIVETSLKYKIILVRLSNVCKFVPQSIHMWYKENLISEDLYTTKILPTLKKLYYYDHPQIVSEQKNVSIHIRRGYLAQRLIKAGFTYEYYKNIIESLNSQYKINIFCENANYDDIKNLGMLKNTTLHIGGIKDIGNDFNNLCTSTVLITSPSSFAAFAGILSTGTVLVDTKCTNFRPNIFKNIEMLPNFISFKENITTQIKNQLLIKDI